MTARPLRLPFSLALLIGGACSLASAGTAPGARGREDPVAALNAWVERCQKRGKELSSEDEDDIRRAIADGRMLALSSSERRREVAQALLDLAAARPAERPEKLEFMSLRSGGPDPVHAEALAALVELLRSEGGAELAGWMATDVLARPNGQPLARRIAAAESLKGLYLPATRLALFGCATEADASLRAAAVLALEGWQDEGVHLFLLDQLERNASEPGWISPRVVRRHFASVRIPSGSDAARALTRMLRQALVSNDWRAATRAISLSGALEDQDAVPELLTALRIWDERRKERSGRLRIEGDLVAELRRRSGRSIGLHPERWEAWWRSRQAASAESRAAADPAAPTVSGFFGLRPVTDRITFVLDGSGSMVNPLGTGGRTRYEEATDQLLGLLETLGQSTSFRVILFADEAVAWSEQARFATPTNLTALRDWMKGRRPRGATHLKPGILAAMRVDARGAVDLARLEADTVIVLCDGATDEGPRWVEPMLDGLNEQACLVFHCVQIGAGGDGTLELLAAGTGGEFVRVAP